MRTASTAGQFLQRLNSHGLDDETRANPLAESIFVALFLCFSSLPLTDPSGPCSTDSLLHDKL